jgi:hypothetical protein
MKTTATWLLLMNNSIANDFFAKEEGENDEAMLWYSNMNIHQRINLKTIFSMLTGIDWKDLSCLFSIKDRIAIAYNKLKLEGFFV